MEAIEITVEALIDASLEKVWNAWNTPSDIMIWNTASPDWHTTKSEVDLKIGGKFSSRMEAKDGSFGFDFWGTYSQIEDQSFIESFLGDGRKMSVLFSTEEGKTKVVETFEAETQNTIELQRGGWQSILDNFKKHVESK